MLHDSKKIYRVVLLSILLLATLLRLWSLGSGDTLSDEVLYSFRAIGMLDFDEAGDQTTPLEWLDPFIPSWTKYSFHDHPPLVFAVQHVFMRVFGETPFAFRLPSALLGIASVYLLYLIGKYLSGEQVGLIAAALLGVTVNHVVISRLGLQEAYVIFFLLLAVFLFFAAERNKKMYVWLGGAVGLALLTKYTTGVLIPIFLTYMLLFRRRDFCVRYVWIGAVLAALLFSPVLYYNLKLYQAVGHFDFQISYLVWQNPEVWSVQPGKEEFPTLAARAAAIFPNLLKFNSWIFLALFAGSSIAFIVSLAKHTKETLRRHTFLLITLFWLLIIIIGIIGPSMRFLAMLTPFLALGIAVTSRALHTPTRVGGVDSSARHRNWFEVVIAVFLLFEILYSSNSQILPYPKGPQLWTWSVVRYENYNWGYHELDEWMREKTDGRMPALAFEPKYHFIGEIHKKALAEAERAGKEPYPALFVYDKNIASIPQLWTLDRLQIYHAWPVIPADTYLTFLRDNGADYFERAGFKEIYYIFPTKNVPWKKTNLTDIGMKLEEGLTKDGLKPYTTLENKRNDETFRIYRRIVQL